MTAADILYRALRDPVVLKSYDADAWNALIRIGRSERLLGMLAARAIGSDCWTTLPAAARRVLNDELEHIRHDHVRARWEINRMAHALDAIGAPVILLKGSAYLHADLPPSHGRHIGDLDILVPRAAIGDVETALKAHGWIQAKTDSYDDQYYRQWMHELPPMAHEERGGVIDVHHTILPLTARLTPDADALIQSAVPAGDGLAILGPAEMVLHSATHLAYDGEFEGGARNAWDIHLLIGQFSTDPAFWDALKAAAARHQLTAPLARALRLSKILYQTDIPVELLGNVDIVDWMALRKMRGRDAFGQQTAPAAARLLYLRGHWLRMPPFMLARHLVQKFRMRRRKAPE